jgi:2-polyprenyl-6-methoxyphenol hydroxylase-like FAD-dependent oxidoreductase
MKTVQYQVVVVGAGSAGTSAAIAAAEQGCSVLLIEKNTYGGGKATAAEVGTICGLFHQRKDARTQWLAKGYAKQFAEKLVKSPLDHSISNAEGLHFLPYRIEDFRQLVAEELERARVEVWFNTTVTKVVREQEHINQLIVQQENQTITILANAVIDCSGDAQVCQLAGMAMIQEETYQAAARVFTLRGLLPNSEGSIQLVLWRALSKGVREGEIPESLLRVYPVPGSSEQDKMSFKYSIPLEVSHQPGNYIELNNHSQQAIQQLVNYLKQHSSVFERVTLESIADEVGIRTGPRPKGAVVLTKSDVVEGKKWQHAVARCAWPMEEWGLTNKVKMTYLEDTKSYEIPMECLFSTEIDNLFFAGRNISAGAEAIASARVMGSCLQTGYAAGVLAATRCKDLQLTVGLLHIQKVQILS